MKKYKRSRKYINKKIKSIIDHIARQPKSMPAMFTKLGFISNELMETRDNFSIRHMTCCLCKGTGFNFCGDICDSCNGSGITGKQSREKSRYIFRAWDNNKKELVYYSDKYSYGDMLNMFEDKDLMFCSNIKDKEGTLIYEGDILQTIDGLFEVVYEWGGFRIYNMKQESMELELIDFLKSYPQSGVKVISNFYEQRQQKEKDILSKMS